MHETFEVISPVDGSVYVNRQFANAQEIEKVLKRAGAAKASWQATTLRERIALVDRFGDEMLKRADDLALAVSWQMGRPLSQADETPRLKLLGDMLGKTAQEALAEVGFPPDDGVVRYVRRVPTGIHLSICAWNYPTAMLGYIVSAPLIAGNVVLLKHSPQTPLVAEFANEAFAAAGGPEGVFQALHMTHPDTETLIASGKFNTINFIGSVAGGKKVHAAAGGTLTHVHLELGGKDPAYVHNDADLLSLIPQLCEGTYSNSGQSCCSVERIYVHEKIYPDFVDAFVEETRNWSVGHPLYENPSIGPVCRASAAEYIRTQVREAINMGAARLTEDRQASLPGDAYVSPEILVDVSHDMPIKRDELFGPVACIQKVNNDETALSMINDTRYGLTASVWTQDLDKGAELEDQMHAGLVYVNRCDHADLHLPWGGFGESGMGRNNGRAGLLSATEEKSFHMRDIS